tara:strand:- start:2103 stop:2381 length:279 start_codon:yes stop_codon:yes gene_type:complete
MTIKFDIKEAVERPYTSHPGKSLYPWKDVEVGKGFHVIDRIVDGSSKKRHPGDIRNSATQWSKRSGNDTFEWQAFRYDHPENGPGVQINRTR